MKILFHRPTPWGSPVQCSTKSLAARFAAEGHDVVYLENLYDPASWRSATTRPPGVGIERVAERLHVLRCWTPVLHRDFWPLRTAPVRSAKYALARPGIPAVLESSGFGRPDLVWNTVPGTMNAFGALFPDADLIAHVVDYYPAFRGEWVREAERDDYRLSDHVFTIGAALRDYIVKDLEVPGEKVSSLGQGVDTALYRDAAPEPDEMSGLPHPRAVWCGVLDKLDEELGIAVADAMAQRGGVFMLLGPIKAKAPQRLLQHAGTAYLGAVDNRRLPSFLAHADIGVMLYDHERNAVYRGQNPLKLYEYAAAGLPILSTPHAEYSVLEPPATIITEAQQVVPAVDAALDLPDSLGPALADFSARHDWEVVYGNIMDRLAKIHDTGDGGHHGC